MKTVHQHYRVFLTDISYRYLGMTGSWEVVARILQRQEILHEGQVEQWKATVNEANQKLLQVSTGSLEVRPSQE